jgi:FixJ family two-component response regulator
MPFPCRDSWVRVRQLDHEGLTPRERACVDREREGLTRERIAHELGLAISTVAQHLWVAHQRGVKLRNPIREQPKLARKVF